MKGISRGHGQAMRERAIFYARSAKVFADLTGKGSGRDYRRFAKKSGYLAFFEAIFLLKKDEILLNYDDLRALESAF